MACRLCLMKRLTVRLNLISAVTFGTVKCLIRVHDEFLAGTLIATTRYIRMHTAADRYIASWITRMRQLELSYVFTNPLRNQNGSIQIASW